MSRWSLVLLVACAAPPAEVETPLPGQTLVYNGSPPDAPHHDAVVALFETTGDGVYATSSCTGTLIAPDVVLTAAHCVDAASYAATWPITMDASALAIYVGDDPADADFWTRLVGVVDVAMHPSYDRWTLQHDIALIRLDRSVTSVTPVPHLPAALGFGLADANMPVDHAGFGQTETGGTDVKLHITMPLDGGPGCAVPGCVDEGDRATQVSYTMALGGPCFGDSGGPMFVQRGASVYVGSVTSYGDPDCLLYGVNTRADVYSSAIDGWIAAAPQAPWQPGPGACGDGVCSEGESCDGRGPTSNCSDCPGVAGGNPSTRYCHVEGSCIGEGC